MGKGMVRVYRDLEVYQTAFASAMEIFEVSKTFPVAERYSLADSDSRSSRSVCANLGEAWRKRRYQAAFVAKLYDCQAEATETQILARVLCQRPISGTGISSHPLSCLRPSAGSACQYGQKRLSRDSPVVVYPHTLTLNYPAIQLPSHPATPTSPPTDRSSASPLAGIDRG